LDFQALAKNPNNTKAMFRKGKALGELGFYDKAVKVLNEVTEKSPEGWPLNSLSSQLL
jgi:Flp pilus assembly protein TadD